VLVLVCVLLHDKYKSLVRLHRILDCLIYIRLIHGFVSREDARLKLIDKECGTFLLRFSESSIEKCQKANIYGFLTLVVVQLDPLTGTIWSLIIVFLNFVLRRTGFRIAVYKLFSAKERESPVEIENYLTGWQWLKMLLYFWFIFDICIHLLLFIQADPNIVSFKYVVIINQLPTKAF